MRTHRLPTAVLAVLSAGTVLVATAAPASAEGGRIAGQSRVATAVAISQYQFPEGSDVAYLARSDVPADALAAGSLTDGPVLLVPSCGALPSEVATELGRLQANQVIALGGPGAVCEELLAEAAATRTRDRLAGAGRYETSAAIARRAFPDGSAAVYVASGANGSPDAVAGGTLTDGPILLLPSSGPVPAAVKAEIDRLAPDRVTALGGLNAVPAAALAGAALGRQSDRYAGASRYETAIAISRAQFPGGSAKAFIARADVFADAVAGGSLTGGPILLVPSCGELPGVVGAELRRLGSPDVHALGGPSAVCDRLLSAAIDPSLPVPPGTETGRVAFDHPTWGPSTLITTVLESRGGWIYVVDASGAVRWSYLVTEVYPGALEPGAAAPDALGHLFVDFNPGRYNGVIVLKPVYDGFEDFQTLPPPDEYNTRFYSAEVVDVDGDGRFEVLESVNDCRPSCAGGTIWDTLYAWDGSDYTPDGPTLDARCADGVLNGGLCRFALAVQTGDWSALSDQERAVAAQVTGFPDDAWSVGDCELIGDVTVDCQVTFVDAPVNSEPTSAGFRLVPVNGEYLDGEIILPPGEELRYEVVEYLGLV